MRLITNLLIVLAIFLGDFWDDVHKYNLIISIVICLRRNEQNVDYLVNIYEAIEFKNSFACVMFYAKYIILGTKMQYLI